MALRNMISAAALVFLVVIIALAAYNKDSNASKSISYTGFLEMLDSGDVSEVILTDAPKIKYKTHSGDGLYETDNPRNPALKEELLTRGVAVSEGSYISGDNILQTAVSIIFFGGAFYFVFRMNSKNGMKSMSISISGNTGDISHVCRFDDVAGNEEAKESVTDIVDYIKNPEKYTRYGARMPRGVIFYGPPGTGKTLLAKAIAGEAGVPFYAVSGSDFVQMYVGVGAGRVRELFKKAREDKKAVIFIDEIDALGKRRSAVVGGGNDERDQTLNALLTEMSGFSSAEGIVVIAATNRLDTLDEALLRPGRFDRQIEIGLPDLNARKMILKHHAENKPLSESVNIDSLARQTVYFSGAMLENLLNEAAISAAKNGSDEITAGDIDKAYYTVVAGSEKKDRSGIREQERKITAYHESGHALAAKLISPENTVSRITIIPSVRGAGGFCVNIPPDKMYYTKKELENQIMVSLAGRAAEDIMFGPENVTTGASNDLDKATGVARDYVSKFGMGDGLLNVESFEDKTSVMRECGQLIDRLYRKVKDVLNENSRKLISVAELLMERETLGEEDLDKVLRV